MDMGSFIGGFLAGLVTSFLLWFMVQMGRASERRALRARLRREEGVDDPKPERHGPVDRW